MKGKTTKNIIIISRACERMVKIPIYNLPQMSDNDFNDLSDLPWYSDGEEVQAENDD